MSAKVPRTAMNLKQFLIRQEVLKLYRDIHRALRQVPDAKTRLELKDWARSDFRKNMHVSDVYSIKGMLNHGKKSLNDLQNNLAMCSQSSTRLAERE